MHRPTAFGLPAHRFARNWREPSEKTFSLTLSKSSSKAVAPLVVVVVVVESAKP
jgi:hypothetical protein